MCKQAKERKERLDAKEREKKTLERAARMGRRLCKKWGCDGDSIKLRTWRGETISTSLHRVEST